MAGHDQFRYGLVLSEPILIGASAGRKHAVGNWRVAHPDHRLEVGLRLPLIPATPRLPTRQIQIEVMVGNRRSEPLDDETNNVAPDHPAEDLDPRLRTGHHRPV